MQPGRNELLAGPPSRADARPRFHIWPTANGFSVSLGVMGNRSHLATIGECMESAYRAANNSPCVVIVEDRF